MKSNIAKGIIGNGLAQITLKVLRVLEQLLLIPFFLTAWGAAYYGEWITLSIIPTVLTFSNFGFGSAVSNGFVLAYTGGDKQKAADINKSGILVVAGSIVVGAIITATILWGGSYFHFFENSIIPEKEAIFAIALLMTGRLISFYHLLIEGYYRGARKAVLSGFLYSGCSAISLIVGFCVLYWDGGIVEYAFSQFCVTILFTVAYFVIGRRLVDLKSYQGKYILLDIKQITSKGMGYMMDPVWQSIYFQGTTFVVRLTLGPEAVAAFNTIRTACRSVSQIFNVVNGSIFPELQYEYGQGNMKTVHRLFRLSVLSSIIIGIIGTIFLSIFGLELYNWWTQSHLSVTTEVWNTFVISILFNAVWWTAMVAYPVTNKPYHFAIVSTITSSLSVVLSYVLSMYLGLWGSSLGVLFFELVMIVCVLPDSCRLFGMKTIELFYKTSEDILYLKNKLCKTIFYR
jgi:O-antigen/teichoic acid export membrane protein